MVFLIVLAFLALAVVVGIVIVLTFFGSFGNFIAAVLNTVIGVAWSIEKFILGIMEALEFIARSLLGIGTTLDDYTEFAKANNFYNNCNRKTRSSKYHKCKTKFISK